MTAISACIEQCDLVMYRIVDFYHRFQCVGCQCVGCQSVTMGNTTQVTTQNINVIITLELDFCASFIEISSGN